MQIHLSTPACCLLPAFQEQMRLSLSKSSTCVCDRSFLFQNIDTVGCLFFCNNQLLFFPSGALFCSFPAERLHSPRRLSLDCGNTTILFSSPWKSVRDLLERNAIAWDSKWIQGRSRVLRAQMIHAPSFIK